MTKTNGKRRAPAKVAISPAVADAAWTRLSEISGPHEEQWTTLLLSLLDERVNAHQRGDDEMGLIAGLPPQPAQALSILSDLLAMRRLSISERFQLGSSEEAMQLCKDVLARGLREPAREAGPGHVLRFPRFFWQGDPLPKQTPPAKPDETFAPGMDEMVGLA